MTFRNLLTLLIFLTALYLLQFSFAVVGKSTGVPIAAVIDATELCFITMMLLKINNDPKLKTLILET